MPEPELSLIFVRPLNRLGIRYVVSGSVASILYGEPRMTNDVDFLVFLRNTDIVRFHEVFPSPEFYVPPSEVIASEMARPGKGQFNVIHTNTGFKADFYIAGRDDLDVMAFRGSRKMDYQGESIIVAPPECVIIRKLEYYREGGSDKHLRDIRAMLAVSGEMINQVELNRWIELRQLQPEWKKAR
jgi:hypothetical protein